MNILWVSMETRLPQQDTCQNVDAPACQNSAYRPIISSMTRHFEGGKIPGSSLLASGNLT
jgi:hypothetical protein